MASTGSFTRLVQFADDHQSFAVPTNWWGRIILITLRDKGVPVAFWNAGFDMHALEGDGFPLLTGIKWSTVTFCIICWCLISGTG